MSNGWLLVEEFPFLNASFLLIVILWLSTLDKFKEITKDDLANISVIQEQINLNS